MKNYHLWSIHLYNKNLIKSNFPLQIAQYYFQQADIILVIQSVLSVENKKKPEIGLPFPVILLPPPAISLFFSPGSSSSSSIRISQLLSHLHSSSSADRRSYVVHLQKNWWSGQFWLILILAAYMQIIWVKNRKMDSRVHF